MIDVLTQILHLACIERLEWGQVVAHRGLLKLNSVILLRCVIDSKHAFLMIL